MNGRCVVLLISCVALGAASAAARASNVLSNGNFDAATSAPWVEMGNPTYPMVVNASDAGISAQSGSRIAWLGGFESSTDALYQDVAVPAGQGALEVTGYYRINSQEVLSGVYDVFTIDLVTTSNTVLEHVLQRTNLDATSGWTAFDYHAIGNYGGQTVRLRMSSRNDDTFVTNFFVDTMVLDATPTTGVPDQLLDLARVGLPTPNPSRGPLQLSLDLAQPSAVRASICDVSGRIVRTLAAVSMEQGAHRLVWDGRDEAGVRVRPGAYFARVEVGARTYRRAVMLIR